MASNQMDINSLVYSYLLKKAPKCAELFSKSNAVKKLPSGSPSLEDVVQKAYPNSALKGGASAINKRKDDSSSSDSSSESDAPKGVQKQNISLQKQNVSLIQNKSIHKSDSSSDSSDSEEASSKPSVPVKGITNAVTNISLNKQAAVSKEESSSSSSDSDDEPPKSMSKPNVNAKNVTKSPFQKAKESSSSSDDSEPGVNNLGKTLAKVPKSNIQVSKAVPVKPSTKKSSSSSDDSSSEPENKVQPPKSIFKSDNWGSAISKLAAEFSDSSDSDSDEPGIAVSLTKKTSTPMGLIKNTESVAVNLRNSILESKKQSDSSDDSSSESENEQLKGKTLNTKNIPAIGISRPPPAKAIGKKDDSSSDDSSDSEDDSKSKIPAKTTPSISKKPDHSISSSNESITKQSQLQIVKVPKAVPLKKPVQNVKQDSSDSSSDSEDEKVILKTPVKQIHPSGKDSSSDSSSDSDDETSKPSVRTGNQINQVNKSKSFTKSPVKTPVLNASKKVSDSSSDSSSDEVSKPPVNKSNVVVKKVASVGLKKDDSSSSSSDSEDEQTQPVTSLNKAPLKLSSPVKKVILPPKATQETSDSSEDSTSSDDDNRTIPSKVTQNKNVSVKASNSLKKPGNDEDSSSSSDSEDESRQPAASSVALAKNPPLRTPPASSKKSESSDSSSDDDDVPVNKPQTMPKVQLVNNKKGGKQDTSSSSSSEDEPPQSAKKSLPKVTPVKPSVQKDSSSSDSSDSDNAENPVMNLKQNALKRSNQIGSNSPNKKVLMSANKSTPLSSNSAAINNKQAESSSDSSSEDDQPSTSASVMTNSVSLVGSNDSRAPKRKKESSDSEEESESENSNKKDKKDQAFLANQNQTFNNQFMGKNPVMSDSTKQRRGSSPFRRVKSENFVVDHRLQKSAQLAKQSLPSFQGVRGKQFRHEKTKKKRLAHPGKVDTSVKSIKFDD